MIDLHVHSTASDGTLAPAEIARRGRDFSVMALTDHDTTSGLEEFLGAAKTLSPGALRLTGIEFSVLPGAEGVQFHMLGLGFDPASARLQALLRRLVAGRDERNVQMLAKFERLGIKIALEELKRYAAGEVLTRPHFANWLVNHGYAIDVKDAFKRYLSRSAPAETNCYCERLRLDPAEVIEAIHAASGVAVMAHPRAYTQDFAFLRAELKRLKDMGLDGVEAVYQANEPAETVEHLRLAKSLDLAVTAGSDFHGANKPAVPLGMTLCDEQALLASFMRALALRGAKGVA